MCVESRISRLQHQIPSAASVSVQLWNPHFDFVFWGGANRTYGRCIPLLIKWRPVARLQPTDPPNLSHNWILNKHQTIILDKNVSFTSFSVRPVCPKNSVPPLNIVGCDGSLFKVCSRVEPGEDTGQEDSQNNDICFWLIIWIFQAPGQNSLQGPKKITMDDVGYDDVDQKQVLILISTNTDVCRHTSLCAVVAVSQWQEFTFTLKLHC